MTVNGNRIGGHPGIGTVLQYCTNNSGTTGTNGDPKPQVVTHNNSNCNGRSFGQQPKGMYHHAAEAIVERGASGLQTNLVLFPSGAQA